MELKKLCLKNNLEIYRFQDSFAKDIERIASIVIVIVNVRKGDCELLKFKRKWFRLSIQSLHLKKISQVKLPPTIHA